MFCPSTRRGFLYTLYKSSSLLQVHVLAEERGMLYYDSFLQKRKKFCADIDSFVQFRYTEIAENTCRFEKEGEPMKTKCKIMSLCMAVLLLFSLAGCTQQAESNSYKHIAPPCEKLEWGMTQEDVLEALELSPEDAGSTNSWQLTYEQLGMKGKIAGLSLSEKVPVVVLGFSTFGDGEVRLSHMLVQVHAENGTELYDALTKAYGTPVLYGPEEGYNYRWVSEDPEKDGEELFASLEPVLINMLTDLSGGEQKAFVLQPVLKIVLNAKTYFEAESPMEVPLFFDGKRPLQVEYGLGK